MDFIGPESGERIGSGVGVLGPGTNVKGNTVSAKKIPFWLWVVIAKLLGIKLHANEKPVISAVLHIFTFGSAVGLFVANAWFSGYNIVSIHSKSDILDGTVSIMVMSFFCGLGVYSHRLAYRLFVHPKFLDMLRLHSKTVFKINSAVVIFFVLTSFVVVLNVSTVNYIYPFRYNHTDGGKVFLPGDYGRLTNETSINPCQMVDVSVIICQTYWVCQVIFSLFFLVWNLMVAVVLVSVTRTHTVSIRRLLSELEQDAKLLDRQIGPPYSKHENQGMNEYAWTDDDSISDYFVERSPSSEPQQPSSEAMPSVREGQEPSSQGGSFTNLRLRIGGAEPSVPVARFIRLAEEDNEDSAIIEPHIMPLQEIMYKYWRINMSIRLSSVALQRWMSSITLLITAWSAIRMVYWLSHTPSLYGVCMFILPLLLLPLLASSYSEVNYEGAKILQSILPTVERVPMFQYLYGQPIQMTVYGHAITYGTIGTVVAGILAAFTSKIFLQEINDL